jgi:cytochrome c oxidase cbb3-type subunit 1
MLDYLKLVILGVVVVCAAIAANYARDAAYLVHMLLFMAAGGGLFLFTLRRMGEPAAPVPTHEYMDGPVRAAAIATAFWGVVGFLVGVFIAFQLAFPGPELRVGPRLHELRAASSPSHLGGDLRLRGQRASGGVVLHRAADLRGALWGGNLAWFVFWGYQLFIVMAATGYLLGIHAGPGIRRARMADGPVADHRLGRLPGLMYLGTLLKRKEPHIYVANWFLLSFIVTVAMLHLVNNLQIPVSLFGSSSVPVMAGVQGAMTQWWYGHNAVGFFLTAGFLGMMYYFVPKQAERPVYSYKLSIIHFWALIFLYIWAGPHHLHYTALPDWASTLGMVFSVVLWMPSWGGMINGLMTLSGAWDKLRTDPVLRMMVTSVAFYGMSTFEGPMMSIRAVNSLSHYTDWTIGHVHSGALGWNGMITFGMLYYLFPKLWNRQSLYSLKAVSWHYWLATIGIVLYAASMWVTGIMEGLMWREVDAQGFLVNSFADTVAAKFPMYVVRGTSAG